MAIKFDQFPSEMQRKLIQKVAKREETKAIRNALASCCLSIKRDFGVEVSSNRIFWKLFLNNGFTDAKIGYTGWLSLKFRNSEDFIKVTKLLADTVAKAHDEFTFDAVAEMKAIDELESREY